jgi:hypothetical protein
VRHVVRISQQQSTSSPIRHFAAIFRGLNGESRLYCWSL